MFFGSPEHLTFLRYKVLSPQRRYAYDVIISWRPPFGVNRITPKCSCQKCASRRSQSRTKQPMTFTPNMAAWWHQCIRSTVRPNKKETRFISGLSLLPRKISSNYITHYQGYFLFFHLIPNTWWYLSAWLKRNNLNSCMSKSICAEKWCWADTTKFRLANPCQNKESKQKKQDKRDKTNANECLFDTSVCSETWQTPLSP